MNSCSSSKEETSKIRSDNPTFKNIAEEKYNDEYRTEFNKDSTYIIVYYSPKNKLMSLNPPLKFFVYDNSTKKVIFRDNLANGKVKWKNNNQFVVSTIPGIVKGDDVENIQMFGYTYDVITRRKLSDLDKNK